MSNNKRILKEYAEITQAPPEGCHISLPNDEDMLIWEAKLTGPPGSVYAGGTYNIQIKLPKEYPFKPPILSFKTKIYHPNVSNDEKGAMCLGILKAEEWKPPYKIKDVLLLVRSTLAEPNPDDSVEPGIADQYKNSYKEFEKVAKEWVTKHAK